MLRSTNSSIFTQKNHNHYKTNEGFFNNDSPMKAAFRGISPKKSLSPLKPKIQKRYSNQCISPNRVINLSPSTNSNNRNTPLIVSSRKQALFSVQNHFEDHQFHRICSPRLNVPMKSFKQVSQRQSEQISEYSFENSIAYRQNNQNCQYFSKKQQNYQTERNPKSNTKIFSQLLSDLEFNRATSQQSDRVYLQSTFSKQYSNNYNNQTYSTQLKSQGTNQKERKSFKNIMINNITTIQSIQSPEEFQFDHPYQNIQIQNRFVQQPFIKKKSSKQCNQSKNQKPYHQPQGLKIDFDLTNSFGSTIKKQIMGQFKKQKIQINPFEQIQKQEQKKQKQQKKQADKKQIVIADSFSLQFSDFGSNDILGSFDKKIVESLYDEQDSQLGTFKVIFDHLGKEDDIKLRNSPVIFESVNISRESKDDSLNMNPFL